MSLEDQFRILVGGYYGICEMDEYDLKIYLLKDIENYIISFLRENPIENFDYKLEASILENKLSLKRKLQDSLLVLHMIDAPLEIVLLVKKKLKEFNDEQDI